MVVSVCTLTKPFLRMRRDSVARGGEGVYGVMRWFFFLFLFFFGGGCLGRYGMVWVWYGALVCCAVRCLFGCGAMC